MTRLSFFIPVFIIMFAVGGAFAMKSANQATAIQVWYLEDEADDQSCTSTDLTPCNDQSGEECRLPVLDVGGEMRTIFKDASCDNAYTRPITP